MSGKQSSPPNIGIIGTGVGGLCAAIQLRKKLKNVSFTIFEKNSDIGGTWFSNRYPGCACDVASHFYSFSFEPNPNWTTNYASQPEIFNYLKTLCTKYSLYNHIKFQHEVKTVTWDEKLLKWIVQYVNVSLPDAVEESIMFDIIIDAPGGLRIPSKPKQLELFEGPRMHTAEWDSSIDIRKKRVAIVGSGATAVQVIPSIADIVDTLHCYQRTPPYVLPRLQFTFPNFAKTIFFYVPFLMWIYRCLLYVKHELTYAAFCPGSILHNLAYLGVKLFRQNQLKTKPHLWNDLTPKHSFGCKRVIVSEQYFPAMARSNVHIHTSHIDKIVGRTIYTKDGTQQEIDVLIMATGFRTQEFFGPMKMFGKDGVDIGELWLKDDPRAYYGFTSSVTPNLFMLVGPNTSLGHNSIIFMIECQVNVIIDAIREMIARNAKTINLKESAENEYMEKVQRDMKKTVWGQDHCGSWYANKKGVVTALWPNTCTDFWMQTKSIDWTHFDFV